MSHCVCVLFSFYFHYITFILFSNFQLMMLGSEGEAAATEAMNMNPPKDSLTTGQTLTEA